MGNASKSRSLLRAVGYVRVSTKRQAEHQVSLVEQEKRIRQWCEQQGLELVRVYVEPGASARGDRRRVFQQMIADATSDPKPFDVVLTYNFSRFFRNDFQFEAYRRQLEEAGVDYQSITQQVASGPAGKLTRGVATLVDAYQSDLNAEATRDAMIGNADAGYWNGSLPPFGYRTYVAERFAKKDKKKLEIDPAEAPVVRLAFDLYLGEAGGQGPMGIIKVTEELNRRGLTHRGKPFRTGTVHVLLRRTTYSGVHYYNQMDSRTRKQRPQDEWIAIDVPPILDDGVFERAQRMLSAHAPRVVPPRSVRSPTLLAGLAKCGHPGCGSGMILSTGKGGQYRYFICDRKRTQSKDACGSKRISMPLVDDIVLSALEDRLLQPDRLQTLLSSVLDHADQTIEKRKAQLADCLAEKRRVEAAKRNLLELVEAGHLTIRDPQLVERLAAHNARLGALKVEIKSLQRQLVSPARKITPEIITRFGNLMRERLRDENPALRQGYVRMLVGEVVIDSENVVIRGSKKALEHAVFAGEHARDGVLTFIREWRTRQDSNL